MKKVYVRVTSDFDATGYMQPKSIVWTNARYFPSRASGTSAPPNLLEISAATATQWLLAGRNGTSFLRR